MDLFAIVIFIISSLIILYHHIGYPFLLQRIAKNNVNKQPPFYHRNYHIGPLDFMLPDICLIMPAYNEEDFIKEKIFNLGALDYPEKKLKIILVCDGCTDNTASAARKASKALENRHLNITILEKKHNSGKLSVLNETIGSCKSEIVALSDVSSLLSRDSLLIASAQLCHESVGVVCGSYYFLRSLSIGEQVYWHYQREIKLQESNMGSTLGVHGAFYAFRREFFEKLPFDTINDDFTLPVSIIEKGLKCLYDPRIVAVELEQATNDIDFKRRQRIATGNIQQAVRHLSLLKPQYGNTALNFLSGKFLRPFMPIFLAIVLFSSAWLSKSYFLFFLIFGIQCMAYGYTLFFILIDKKPSKKITKILFYILSGHLAMGVGLIRYLFVKEPGSWRKVSTL